LLERLTWRVIGKGVVAFPAGIVSIAGFYLSSGRTDTSSSGLESTAITSADFPDAIVPTSSETMIEPLERLPSVLALQVAPSCRPACGPRRHPRFDPDDQPRQPAVGRATHSWRAAETWDRHRPVDCRQVHVTASRPSLSGLAGFPTQARANASLSRYRAGPSESCCGRTRKSRMRPGMWKI